jgi:hypothetical protein
MSFFAKRFRSLAVIVPLRVGIAFFCFLLLPASLVARPMEGATYQQMSDKADLVLIAKPLSSKDTDEHTMLPELGVYSRCRHQHRL